MILPDNASVFLIDTLPIVNLLLSFSSVYSEVQEAAQSIIVSTSQALGLLKETVGYGRKCSRTYDSLGANLSAIMCN
jgi:hypothetical protein